MVRVFAGVYRASLHLERVIRYRGFAWLVVAWLGVMVVSSMALYVAENGVNEAIDTPLDALWWGVTTLTTVGYGDVYPTTAEGRVAASALMLLGISLFSAITATITSYILESRREVTGSGGIAGELERLARLRSSHHLSDQEFAAAKARILG
jgi:voltage-gated potassium channel